MWTRRSHTLEPLNRLTSIKQIFKCSQVKQDTLE